ncbi:hypothetical protein IWX83_000111 [Flavobacterium sp. CG_9.1]|uniref:carboxypeptidase-like regulatory domain-containing protein n=1 Tax=Flavobacterium sp. CG_9.1 TaxID=2787728 RepID=UPI001A2C1807|nr:carboxypeptidase-like regulatory domain-containing protein [Flavobacterium sp. CG_9.1]MBG6060348.1 hypothetical protein [Flavobacterium sp. CG_9.1]
MGKIKLIVFFAFFSLNAIAQIKIAGSVIDIQNKPILSASIILKDNNGKIISYTYSNELGKYNISTNNKGKLILLQMLWDLSKKVLILK